MAKKFADDEEHSKTFSGLADMEQRHMQLMLKRYLGLKEDLSGPLML